MFGGEDSENADPNNNISSSTKQKATSVTLVMNAEMKRVQDSIIQRQREATAEQQEAS